MNIKKKKIIIIISEDFDANVEYKNQGVQEIILSEKGLNFSFI